MKTEGKKLRSLSYFAAIKCGSCISYLTNFLSSVYLQSGLKDLCCSSEAPG